MKTTPHTIFIYSWGNYLRIVRGEHTTPDVATKPRIYPSLDEALAHEHRPRIVAALRLLPPDKLLDRRLKAAAAPVKVKSHRTLAEAIRSSKFLYAQAGYDSDGKEIAYIYHREPNSATGLSMVKTGPIAPARKLLKKYRKPNMRNHDYRDPTRKFMTERIE